MTSRHMNKTSLSNNNTASLGPSWKINLLVICGLICIVLAYSLWQIAQLKKNFNYYSREHARVVSGVIEQNTRTAGLAENALRQTIKTFLGNTARFIDYLDSVEPFSPQELDAFAGETGLSAIRIQPSRTANTTEKNNSMLPAVDCRQQTNLDYLADQKLYIMTWPRAEKGCIILGFSASHIEKLHQQLRVPALLKALSALPGIKYVVIDDPQHTFFADEEVQEQKITVGDTILKVGFDTSRYTSRVRQVWRNVLIFSILLLFLGIFSSWLLYRYQEDYLKKITDYERRLAQEKEDAALGRATATITHEIRNPLNAISMGLQRIEIEAEELSSEHRQLAATMRKAVARTNTIIGNLLRYSRPITAHRQPVNLEEIIESLLVLYRVQCDEKKITVNFEKNPSPLSGDNELLGQLFENLIKNAVEAQDTGGYISVSIKDDGKNFQVTLENRTLTKGKDPAQLLEPYFTTKTRGTGLGLPMARRIAEAHGGSIEIKISGEKIFTVTVTLPHSL